VIDVRVIAAVGIGAALGGILRLLVTQFIVARAGAGFGFYATLFINVSGSFLIGVVIEMAQTRANVSPLWRYFLATGVLGGYTTFSTFSYEAFNLATTGFAFTSLLYVAGSVVLGIAAAFGGIVSARELAP
jgi:fluoride exporter